MEAITASSSQIAEKDNGMLKIELEAAEALAALAHVAAVGEPISERVRAESTAGNSCFGAIESFSKRSINVDEKNSQKTCIWTGKAVTNEQKTELRSNASCFTKYASSSGKKSKRNMTEAEMEARKIHRVLANRESARESIRRRQAMFEDLTRKAGDLAWENKNLKMKKEMASNKLNYLKSTNECLKAKVTKVKAGEIHDDPYSSSSNSPIMMPNQPSFLPFTWPPLIVLPHPWLFSFLQNTNNQHHPRSFNLNEKPVDSTSPGNIHSNNKKIMHKSHQVPDVCSTRSVSDMAAAEARKRKRQLKLQKNICCQQRNMC